MLYLDFFFFFGRVKTGNPAQDFKREALQCGLGLSLTH